MPDLRHSHRSRNLSIDRLVLDERTAVLCLQGDLDLWSAPHLKSELRDLLSAGHAQLVLDLGRVPFMDSTALGVMVAVQRRFGAEERMAIAAAAPAVLRVFELSGLATSLRVFATREAAVSYVSGSSPPTERETTPLTADAALMLGIASTAMPFADSAEDQAERWLRALRNHGEAGAVLASLGLSEAALEEFAHEPDDDPAGRGDPDAVATVTRHASRIAEERNAAKLGTTDILRAVVHVYGPTFYRVLAAHAVDPAELTARIAAADPAPAEH
jgi:anti-sigma B factor antagonist